VVLDESSGDLSSGAAGPALERLSPNLADVLQTSVPAGVGYARSLRLQNATSVSVETYARVRSTACTTDCGADDVYRLRAYETTLRIPRFNAAAAHPLGTIVLIGLSWAFFQHLFSGIRHLVMDTGAAFELGINKTAAILTIVGSLAATAALWFYILGVRS
jgi:hypothetical protein